MENLPSKQQAYNSRIIVYNYLQGERDLLKMSSQSIDIYSPPAKVKFALATY